MNIQKDTVYDAKAANWTNAEVEKLVEIWAEPQMQLEIDSTYRNFFVFEKISNRLAELGMIRPAAQCRVKIKNLKSSYTKLRDTAPNELEKLKIRSPAFIIVEDVLTNKVLDVPGVDNQADDSFDQSNLIKIESHHNHQHDDDEDDYETEEYIQESYPSSSTSSKNVNKNIMKTSFSLGKRKRMIPAYEQEDDEQMLAYENGASKKMNLENVMKKLDKLETTFQEGILTLQQQLRDERKFYMECEERRLKFFAELEEKRRRDEREHELKLFKLFSDVKRNASADNSSQNHSSNDSILGDITISRSQED
ncbi:hypothetical protein LOTGIDRAFT_234109 [Lottia gigantea]|uniref:Myb/SANT-like DNA-binding domain-containing protein n=1 Tax=Lottia gigantea TaxID=225164 RepID=V4A3Y8_LOTGI|nr:hypothetical protein LOTGIDRAFT_234109 [Lottia gigantea]ESO89705.1 hypothetical protein LOTGIDRAFT_234109 [Lottia gigantea]